MYNIRYTHNVKFMLVIKPCFCQFFDYMNFTFVVIFFGGLNLNYYLSSFRQSSSKECCVLLRPLVEFAHHLGCR